MSKKTIETTTTETILKSERGRKKIMNENVDSQATATEATATEATATEATATALIGYHQCAIKSREDAVAIHRELTEAGKKLDYTKAIIVNSIVKSADDEAEAKEYILNNHLCDDKDYLNKLIRVVDRFITVDTKSITGIKKANVDVLKDKNGMKFNLSQLMEMLSIKTEDIVTLINEGKLKANMNTKSGENNIRDVVAPFKPNAGRNKTTKDKKDKNNGTSTSSCKNDKERIILISKLLSEITTETIVTHDDFENIRETIAMYEDYADGKATK